jgi:hypothetical protein
MSALNHPEAGALERMRCTDERATKRTEAVAASTVNRLEDMKSRPFPRCYIEPEGESTRGRSPVNVHGGRDAYLRQNVTVNRRTIG